MAHTEGLIRVTISYLQGSTRNLFFIWGLMCCEIHSPLINWKCYPVCPSSAGSVQGQCALPVSLPELCCFLEPWSRAQKRHQPALAHSRGTAHSWGKEVVVAVAVGEIDPLCSQEMLFNHNRPARKLCSELVCGRQENILICFKLFHHPWAHLTKGVLVFTDFL